MLSPELANCRLALLEEWIGAAPAQAQEAAIFILGGVRSDAADRILLGLLKHGYVSVKVPLLHALVMHGNDQVIEELAEETNSWDWRDRMGAIRGLAECATPAARAALIANLQHADNFVRSSAAHALGNMPGEAGDEVRERLEALSQDDGQSSMVRVYAAEALWKLNGSRGNIAPGGQPQPLDLPTAAFRLIQGLDADGPESVMRLRQDSYAHVWDVAAATLCRSDGGMETEVYLLLAEHQVPNVRAYAAAALGRVGSYQAEARLLTLVEDLVPVSPFALNRLPELFGADLPAVFSTLINQRDLKVSDFALAALAIHPNEEMSRQLAEDEDPYMRRVAAELLNPQSDTTSLDALRLLVGDPVPMVVASALASIGSADDDGVWPALLQAVHQSNWVVQLGATIGLELFGSRGTDRMSRSIATMNQDDPQAEATRVIHKTAEGSAMHRIVLTYGFANPTVWRTVAREVAEQGDRTVEQPLMAALVHPDETIRESAAFALGLVGTRAAIGPLIGLLEDASWQVRLTALNSLAQIEDTDIDLLRAALVSGRPPVRAGIASLLGLLRRPDSVAPLIQALMDPGRLVRTSAAKSLGNIGDPIAVDMLIPMLKDPDRGVRNSAAAALRHLGTPEAKAAVTAWDTARRTLPTRV